MAGELQMNWAAVMAPQGRWSGLVTVGSSAAEVGRHCSGLAYLAVPFAVEIDSQADWRGDRSVRMSALASIEMARLLRAGCVAVCPALQRAEISLASLLPIDAPEPPAPVPWEAVAAGLRNVSRLIVVPDLPGWNRCPEILGDVVWALAQGLPVHLYAGGAA